MVNKKNGKKDKRNTYIFASQVVSFLILAILILRIISPLNYNFYDINFSTLMFIFLVLIIILLRKENMFVEILSNVAYVSATTVFLFYEQENIFKILFFMPIVINALKHGVKPAFLTSLISVVSLAIVGYYHDFYAIDADIMLSCVMFLLAWLLGNMTETEGKMRSELEATGQYLNAILDGFPNGVITFDKNSKVSFVNKKAIKILKCEANDLLGISLKEVSARFFNDENYLPSVITQFKRKNLREIKNKITDFYDSKGIMIKLKIDVLKLGKQEFMCLFDKAKKQQELADLELQTQTILNSVKNIIVIMNQEGIIIKCNQAFEKTVGMYSKDFLGCSFREFIDPKHLKVFELLVKEIDENIFRELTLISSKGEKKEFLIHTSAIYNVDGESIGLICVGSDITLKKKKDREAQQREKLALLGQMAAGIVHEIKNPLTTIKGFSQFLVSKATDDELVKHLRIVEKEADEVNKVVSDFLAFAKPHPPSLEKISLNQLIQSIKVLLENHLFIIGIDLKINLSKDQTRVMVDKNQIRQVILNIVHNAVDAMAETVNPCLTIATGYNEVLNEAFIKISNNGEPISKEEIDRLGTPFFTTKEKGTGLGLSICYQIINEHNGRIDVESDEINGTSFTISLPTVNKIKQIS